MSEAGERGARVHKHGRCCRAERSKKNDARMALPLPTGSPEFENTAAAPAKNEADRPKRENDAQSSQCGRTR